MTPFLWLRINPVTDKQVAFHYQQKVPERLDKFLVTCLSELSRSHIQRLIREGYVQVNGQVVNKTGTKLEKNSKIWVTLPPPKPSQIIPENIPLDIIFENDDLMVVNKPAGLVVHPAVGHMDGTLVHAALAHAPQMDGVGGQRRPGIVHRLDKNTSGLIILAKNDFAHRWLQKQFKERKVEKWYLALVDGHPPTPKGRIEAPIGRDRSHRQRMAVVPLRHGREAITEYFTKERFEKYTFLEVHILTGRTHQIRVHMSFIGCPVVGDTVYGHQKPSLPINRQFLHATRLKIVLPREDVPRQFEAPLAKELENILNSLRKKSG
ncbi:MAG TPA: RluA family pseudouridine synthase [Anaerolineae bacterium]|nr:RluA family pseudouridine synthase [Anaerolineae bacterium]